MSSEERLGEIREGLDRLDAEMIRLLGERRKLSAEMIRTKEESKSPLRDQKREEDMLSRRIQIGRTAGLDSHYVTRIFHEVIEDSVRLQQDFLLRRGALQDSQARIRVAFQGIEGAYSHLAAKKFFAASEDRLETIGLPTFEEVTRAVEDGAADFAMLPVENTTAGCINEVVDLLYHTRLSVVGEEKFKVEHCLVATEDVPLGTIRRIFSHPQAIAQCSVFLGELANCQVEYFTDTAMSVKRIHEERDPTQAAIASEEAARSFNLSILKRGIANQRQNYTRFLVMASEPRAVDLRVPAKTSLVMATTHTPGSLVEALLVFKEHRINLTDLVKRPVLGTPWEVFWYVDFEGNLDDEAVRASLEELKKQTRFLKVLGSYPAKDLERTVPNPAAVAGSAAGALPGAGAGAGAGESPGKPDLDGAPAKPPSKKGYRLASREQKPEDTIIQVKGVNIGGEGFVVIAGPCSVESREQIFSCARQVKECGAQILRGGCFKPRTSPYAFQGLEWPGLEMLVEAGEEYSLPIITEVMAPEDVERVARKADILQIGARNMQNFRLLNEVGRVNRPVMLKRGLMSSIDELLHAAEYILAKGNHQVMLCERGIRTFETATRNTFDISAVPVLKALTHLPVIADPSHAAGVRDLIPPLAKAAKAAGAHGVMVEIHPDPAHALSDGPQALLFPQFARLMAELHKG
jgi:chorismate mutase/prephenate dehydratase